ncbi:hypothetical protein BDM02DRAFT_3117392 [Thelephora ganbajun]|uniref:Uncharacterized protein n=1 Tax=Thelephora ganbajun TaxID=370292 RepID=A0ACB6ZCY6_THEGA|nr:hypothetical protein BDM02DRAFT_3117392 [Thelephora ganbajun]
MDADQQSSKGVQETWSMKAYSATNEKGHENAILQMFMEVMEDSVSGYLPLTRSWPRVNDWYQRYLCLLAIASPHHLYLRGAVSCPETFPRITLSWRRVNNTLTPIQTYQDNSNPALLPKLCKGIHNHHCPGPSIRFDEFHIQNPKLHLQLTFTP